MNPSGGDIPYIIAPSATTKGTSDLIAPEYRKAIPSGNSGAIKLVIRDADCFEQITGTEASYQGHALHKTGKRDFL